MGVPFDYAPERPEHIDAILNGLDRYNPETTTVFQDYVVSQCENQTYDCYANLALLKLLCLALLPPHVLAPNPAANSLAEAVQKLNTLHSQLIGASYDQFWSSLDGDDLYADLIADVQGFEELMRVRQAVVISQTMQSVDRAVLESWLNLNGEAFDKFVKDVCGWTVEGSTENEARGTVVRENVKFDQFSRMIKRAYEQPA
ncbi:unnamed protein product [Aureobasidium vineae]|uniref:Eukaryotic translation initiation factor 3 subunit K n=1 Tax=Aureobasidium vineae TaxID=2773715 RepID=A0A9N8JGE0_9PEZI|nr:unnamed protein product [Aureobasidium vineae]